MFPRFKKLAETLCDLATLVSYIILLIIVGGNFDIFSDFRLRICLVCATEMPILKIDKHIRWQMKARINTFLGVCINPRKNTFK